MSGGALSASLQKSIFVYQLGTANERNGTFDKVTKVGADSRTLSPANYQSSATYNLLLCHLGSLDRTPGGALCSSRLTLHLIDD